MFQSLLNVLLCQIYTQVVEVDGEKQTLTDGALQTVYCYYLFMHFFFCETDIIIQIQKT